MKHWHSPSRWLAIAFASLLLALTWPARADLICRNPDGIEGYSSEAYVAKHLVGSDTSDPQQLKVYLTHRGDQLYAHSNFVTQTMIQDHNGASAPNYVPTKIALDTALDFPAIVMNLLGDDHLTVDAYNQLSPRIAVYMDEDLVRSRWRNLDFGRAQVYVTGENLGVLSSRQFRFPNGTVERFASFGGLYSRVPDVTAARSALTRLNSETLDAGRVRILPLTTNTATLNELRATAKASLIEGSLGSLEDLRKVVRDAPGSLVVVLGHFENGSFVMNDAGGKELLRAPLQQLSAIASEAGVGLIPLGCHSAEGGGGGSATKFNTLLAAKRLGEALKSDNYGGFLKAIGGDDMEFIFDPASTDALRKTTDGAVVLEVYDAGSTKDPVGTIRRTGTIAFQRARPLPATPPSPSNSAPGGGRTSSVGDGPNPMNKENPKKQEVSNDDTPASWYGAGALGVVALIAVGYVLRRRAAAKQDVV